MTLRAHRSWLVLAAVEGWALGYLLLSACTPSRFMLPLLVSNDAARETRLLFLAVPLAGAGLAVAALGLALVRQGFRLESRHTNLLRAASPLCALWIVPSLLRREAFVDHALSFMVLAAAVAWGLDGTLREAWPVWQELARKRTWPRVQPVVFHAVLGVAVIGFAWFGAFYSVRVHDKMLTSIFDLGLFENLFFNTLHGRPGMAVEIPYFGQHAELILYLLVPVYALFPSADTLLVVQALLVSGTAVPLYLIARRLLGEGLRPLAIALSYLMYPAIHGPLFFDFHFLTVSSFFLAWTAYFWLQGSRWGFWISLVLSMACREDVALGVAAVALVGNLASWPRPRLLMLVAVVAGAWFAVLKFWWMPQFLPSTFAPYYADLIPKDSHGFGGVLQTLLSDPPYVLGTLLREDKLLLALQLMVPLLALPLWKPRLLPLLLPGFLVVFLATSRGAILQINFHYVTHFVPYLFVGACFALSRASRDRQDMVALSMLLIGLVCTHQFGALFVDRFQTSFHKVSFDWTDEDVARQREFAELASLIPPDALVAAGEHEGPHLATRPRMITLKGGPAGFEYGITSKRSLRWGGGPQLAQALLRGEYGVLEVTPHFLLVRRGAATARNREGVQFLRR